MNSDFEKWIKKEYGDDTCLSYFNAHYINSKVQLLWEGFRAGRKISKERKVL